MANEAGVAFKLTTPFRSHLPHSSSPLKAPHCRSEAAALNLSALSSSQSLRAKEIERMADSSAMPKWLQKSSTGTARNPRSSENLRAYFSSVSKLIWHVKCIHQWQ
jgi:hypothetical protein